MACRNRGNALRRPSHTQYSRCGVVRAGCGCSRISIDDSRRGLRGARSVSGARRPPHCRRRPPLGVFVSITHYFVIGLYSLGHSSASPLRSGVYTTRQFSRQLYVTPTRHTTRLSVSQSRRKAAPRSSHHAARPQHTAHTLHTKSRPTTKSDKPIRYGSARSRHASPAPSTCVTAVTPTRHLTLEPHSGGNHAFVGRAGLR